MLTLDSAIVEGLKTPCYVYEPNVAVSDYQRLRNSLGTGLIVSIKANPTIDLLDRSAHAFVDGVELSSESELAAVHGRTGFPKFVNTPALTETLCRAALRAKATLVLDNGEQAKLLLNTGQVIGEGGVWLRLNSSSLRQKQGGASHIRDAFGMDVSAALDVAAALRVANTTVSGLHVFAGSNTWPSGTLASISGLTGAVKDIERALGYEIKCLNLGGGFPVQPVDPMEMERYRQAVEVFGTKRRLVHEAGRAVFANAGAFVVRVLATKVLHQRQYVVCDGGLAHNFLLCQTEQFIKNFARPRHFVASTKHRDMLHSDAILVGPSCSPLDTIGVLSAGKQVPEIGDCFVFDRCGAYNSTYSPTHFLSLDTAKVYIMPGSFDERAYATIPS